MQYLFHGQISLCKCAISQVHIVYSRDFGGLVLTLQSVDYRVSTGVFPSFILASFWHELLLKIQSTFL